VQGVPKLRQAVLVMLRDAQRIRGYWGVENKVHHVRDVTQGEDTSRIRMHQLPQIFTVARNFALNLDRANEFSNMAQAERFCKFGLVQRQ
jgi:hypothetical protein